MKLVSSLISRKLTLAFVTLITGLFLFGGTAWALPAVALWVVLTVFTYGALIVKATIVIGSLIFAFTVGWDAVGKWVASGTTSDGKHEFKFSPTSNCSKCTNGTPNGSFEVDGNTMSPSAAASMLTNTTEEANAFLREWCNFQNQQAQSLIDADKCCPQSGSGGGGAGGLVLASPDDYFASDDLVCLPPDEEPVENWGEFLASVPQNAAARQAGGIMTTLASGGSAAQVVAQLRHPQNPSDLVPLAIETSPLVLMYSSALSDNGVEASDYLGTLRFSLNQSQGKFKPSAPSFGWHLFRDGVGVKIVTRGFYQFIDETTEGLVERSIWSAPGLQGTNEQYWRTYSESCAPSAGEPESTVTLITRWLGSAGFNKALPKLAAHCQATSKVVSEEGVADFGA